MKRTSLVLLSLLAAATAGAQPSPCDGSVDHTAIVQNALDMASLAGAGPALLAPGETYCINGNVGLNIRSDVRLELRGATLAMNPGCARAGFVCRVLNFLPGSARAEVLGPGVIEGDDSAGCASCWSILVRIDSSEAALRRLTLRRSRSDLVWIGGNVKSSALLDQVVGDRAGRNLLSVVNAREVIISRGIFTNAYGQDPGACLDIEPNPGESVDQIVVLWSRFQGCQLGIVNQKGQGLQGNGFIAAWNYVSDIRLNPGTPLSRVPTGLAVNGVIGSVLFQNDINIPMWPGTGAVPLAGTIAGNSVALAATDAYLLNNRITGAVNDRGTPTTADDVFSGDFRFANALNVTTVGTLIRNGKFTSALGGVLGDDVKLRNEVR